MHSTASAKAVGNSWCILESACYDHDFDVLNRPGRDTVHYDLSNRECVVDVVASRRSCELPR